MLGSSSPVCNQWRLHVRRTANCPKEGRSSFYDVLTSEKREPKARAHMCSWPTGATACTTIPIDVGCFHFSTVKSHAWFRCVTPTFLAVCVLYPEIENFEILHPQVKVVIFRMTPPTKFYTASCRVKEEMSGRSLYSESAQGFQVNDGFYSGMKYGY